MRLYTLLFLIAFALGCNQSSSTDAPIPNTENESASNTDTASLPVLSDNDEVTEATSISYTLNDLDSIIPRPIKSESDAQICLDAAKKMSDRIHRLTGVADKSRTERLADCVVQYDDDGSYSKYFPDGKRVRLYFRSSDLADINIFAPGEETAIAHFRFDETSIIISGQDSDPIGQLILMRSDTTEPFSRLGDWSKINEPDRLEKYALDLYNDFVANSK